MWKDSAVEGSWDDLLASLGADPNPIRAGARDRLVEFMEYEGRGQWQRERHLEILCNKLEQVAAGWIPRLMVFMPPRHGKSEVCSKKFPAWYLPKYPDNYIMITSYSADLAFDFSRIARDTLINERELFPMVNVSTKAVKHWTIEGHHGGLIAAGAGGPIAGRGFSIGIIDDPFKNYEEASSRVTRESIWQWYRSTFYTRRAPGAAIVLIMTRWHEDDLAGRLLAEMETGDGEEWEVLSLAAEALDDDPLGRAKGEPLSPRFPTSELVEIRKAIGSYHFGALYQQNPRPEEGNYFKLPWFVPIDLSEAMSKYKENGAHIPVYAAMDLAIAEGEENDFNVITVGLSLPGGEKILADVRRFRGDTYEIIEQILDVEKTWHPSQFLFEEGAIRKSIWPVLVTEMKKKVLPINAYFVTPILDKVARARALQGQMRLGLWLFPKNKPWYQDYEDRMLMFPNVTFDDEIDAHAYLARMMSGYDSLFDALDLDACAGTMVR
ncbi:MAG: hypothetical protein GY841_23575 [FCB group bacterium]|nr:hypothetical protein [FCB group bacterium]